LQPGDPIALVSPSSPVTAAERDRAAATLHDLGYTVRPMPHLLDRHGYFAGTDADRAADLNAAFADPEIRAILAMRGGWGANRILSRLDYGAIAQNPKWLIGYSDTTALLLAIYARTGLVTLHGPVGISTWNDFSRRSFQAVVAQDWQATGLMLPIAPLPVIERWRGGRSRGTLLGGNLSVLASLIGSDWLPNFADAMLFLEDTGEAPYRIDRLLTQLVLAGVGDRLQGLIMGQCTDCTEDPVPANTPTFTITQVLRHHFHEHFGHQGQPGWYGAPIGHIADKWTLPVGWPVEIDGDRAAIRLLPRGDLASG
jgi:muramoyltetrapeptide carboxypeptidase